MYNNETKSPQPISVFNNPTTSIDPLPVRLFSPYEILSSSLELKWIVPGLIQCPGLIISVGPSKIGKTTLMVKTAISIASGTPILEIPTTKSKVLYISLEGGMPSAKQVFSKMGVKRTDDLRLIIHKPEGSTTPSENLRKIIEASGAKVIFIDSMILWERRFNENSYTEVYEVLGRYSKIASDLDVSIIFTHHTAKSAMEGTGDGALGSTAWYGAVDSKIQLLRSNMVPHIKIDHRNSPGIEAKPIYFDREEGTISLLPPVFSLSELRIRQDILQTLKDADKNVRASDLMKIKGNDQSKIKILKILCSESLICAHYEGENGRTLSYSLVPESSELVDLTECFEASSAMENWSAEDMEMFLKTEGKCE